MARVDLQCGCGYMFFVSDAQASAKGGVKCPACMGPVYVPPVKPAAAPGAPKAAPRPAATADAFESVGSSNLDSRKKLIIIGAGVGAAVIAIIVILALALSGPKVDYDKQAEKAEADRKRAFEEINSKSAKGKPEAFTPLPPAGTPLPAPTKKSAPPIRPDNPPKPMTPVMPVPAQNNTPPPSTGPKAPANAVGMNVETVNKIRTEVLPLHPYYLGLVLSPSEKARVEGILASGKGIPEDADFLVSILNGGKLKAVRDEIAAIQQGLPLLEKEAQDSLPVDRITTNDDRPMNCRILDEGAEIVKVERRMSTGVLQLPLRRDNIKRIEKGKGVGAEFPARWESAKKGSIASQVETLVWCKDNNLISQAKLIAYTVVSADPSNTQARTEAGLPADPVKFSEDMAKGGIIVYQGKNWTPKDLKEKFLKDGNTLLDGQWFSKKERMITVPGLFRYETQKDKVVTFGGTLGLCHDLDIQYKTVQDVNSNSFVEQQEVKFMRRFYAPEMKVFLSSRLPPGVIPPVSTYELDVRLNIDEGNPTQGTPMKGEVTINVPIGAQLLEASVITIAEVKAGGSIVVYHVTGSGENEKRTKLYSCDPKEQQSHVIPPELIRGLTEINLVAVIEETANYSTKVDRRHVRGAVRNGKVVQIPAVDVVHHRLIPEYKAVLFPSNSNTVEVFRLRVWTADPSPGLNKLFASNPEVLK